MKISALIFIFALTSLTTFSQELKYDDLFTGKRPMGPYKSYVSKDGTIYKVGDKVKIGTPVPGYTFGYIWVGDGVIFQEELLGPYGSNTEVEIKRIIIGGSKKSGFKALFRTTSMPGMIRDYIIIVEKALESGEIKRPGLSRIEGLSKLRDATEKLDSGLINQHQFDSIKVVVTEYVK